MRSQQWYLSPLTLILSKYWHVHLKPTVEISVEFFYSSHSVNIKFDMYHMYTCSSWVEILSKRNEMYWVNTHSNRKRSSLFELDFTKIMIFVCTGECCIYIYIWLVVYIPLWKLWVRQLIQLGIFFPSGKIQSHVPNHQIWSSPKLLVAPAILSRLGRQSSRRAAMPKWIRAWKALGFKMF